MDTAVAKGGRACGAPRERRERNRWTRGTLPRPPHAGREQKIQTGSHIPFPHTGDGPPPPHASRCPWCSHEKEARKMFLEGRGLEARPLPVLCHAPHDEGWRRWVPCCCPCLVPLWFRKPLHQRNDPPGAAMPPTTCLVHRNRKEEQRTVFPVWIPTCLPLRVPFPPPPPERLEGEARAAPDAPPPATPHVSIFSPPLLSQKRYEKDWARCVRARLLSLLLVLPFHHKDYSHDWNYHN